MGFAFSECLSVVTELPGMWQLKCSLNLHRLKMHLETRLGSDWEGKSDFLITAREAGR